jgi:hypothetical protein
MVVVKDIIWDIDLEDGETYEEACEDCELPSAVEIDETKFADEDGLYDDDDICNYLSDEFGFCIVSFNFETK